MKTKTTLAQLKSANFVTLSERVGNITKHHSYKNGKELVVSSLGEKCGNVFVRDKGARSEPGIDYFVGHHFDTVSAAISYCESATAGTAQ